MVHCWTACSCIGCCTFLLDVCEQNILIFPKHSKKSLCHITSQSWIICSLGPGVSLSFCCDTFCFQGVVRSTCIIFIGNGCKKYLTPDRILLQKWWSRDSETLKPEWSRWLFHAAHWYLGWDHVAGESAVSQFLSVTVWCWLLWCLRNETVCHSFNIIILYAPKHWRNWGGWIPPPVYFNLRIVFFLGGGYWIEEGQIKNWSEVGERGVCILRTDFRPVFLHFLTWLLNS
jgi:hypothetical protein